MGALSPVNNKELYQGWKKTSVYLLVILHTGNTPPKKKEEKKKKKKKKKVLFYHNNSLLTEISQRKVFQVRKKHEYRIQKSLPIDQSVINKRPIWPEIDNIRIWKYRVMCWHIPIGKKKEKKRVAAMFPQKLKYSRGAKDWFISNTTIKTKWRTCVNRWRETWDLSVFCFLISNFVSVQVHWKSLIVSSSIT